MDHKTGFYARSIGTLLEDYVARLEEQTAPVRVADVLEVFHERGFGGLLLFFALPMALPVPVPPVINVILALPLLFLTAQQALGRHVIWFPAFILRKSFDARALRSLLVRVVPFLHKLESLTRPRLIMLTGRMGQIVTGLLGVLMALSVMVPLPLTNTVPSFGIALMALGVLMRDGVAVCVGALVGTLWVLLLIGAFLFFGMEGFDMVRTTIKSFFIGA